MREGYLNTSSISPTSLGATVAVNGAILGLLLTMASGVISEIPKVIQLIPISPTKAPPPTPTDEVKQTKQKPVAETKDAAQPVTTTKTSAVEGTNTLTSGAEDGTIFDGNNGGEITTPPIPPVEVDPIVIPDPVMVAARVDPRHKDSLQPPYPPSMQREGAEGVVVVRVQIGTDGRVKAVEAVRADREEFLRATREQALRRWRFQPATRDGVAIESWREMTVRFEMPRRNA